MFINPSSGVTDDRFNTSSHAMDVGSDVVGLLLTIVLNYGPGDVSIVLSNKVLSWTDIRASRRPWQ